MSCSPLMAWITEPEQRKRQALKKACVTRWKRPAVNAPTPTPMNMKPSWETVEEARTFLMSHCRMPIVAANSAVSAPTMATPINAVGEGGKGGVEREPRETQAGPIGAGGGEG